MLGGLSSTAVPEMDFDPSAMSGRSQRWRVAIVALVLWISLILGLRYQHDLEPNFCDPFGYARQAELFRQHGFWGGLDTAIDAPQSRLLVGAAKAAFPGSTAWFQSVGPLCHHYDPHTDKIILQYPPGTGMLLSLFPFAYAMPLLQIAGSLIVACLVTWLAISYRLSKAATLAIAVSVALLFWVLARNLAYWSASIPVTLLLIPWIAALGAGLTTRPRYAALLFGIVAGLLIMVRLPNALLLLGPLIEQCIAARLWQWRNVKHHVSRALLAGVGLLIGIAPLLRANWINTGSVFRTTYPSYDATAPSIDADLMGDSLKHYFTTPLGAPLLIAALGFITLGIVAWSRSRDRGWPAGSLGAAGMLLVSIAFFATHAIRTHYYLIASSVMAIAMVTMELSTAQAKPKTPKAYLWLLPLLVIAGVAMLRVKPYQPDVRVPREIMDPQAVVWANEDSGTLYYLKQRYASTLHRTEPAIQDAFVDMLRQAHRTQYFVVDSQHALEACDRQAARYGMSYVGPLGARPPASVWKLGDGGGSVHSCAKPAQTHD
jgi:hypothetical protein